jgi:hypothetical protein
MNPNQDTNEYVREIQFNIGVMLDAIDLGPPPQMIRAPSHHAYEEVDLIADHSFEMPCPCEKCYIFSCNGECSQETEIIPRQLSFEEEMDLPPPPALTRRVISGYLPDEVWRDMNIRPQSLTRTYTNDHLLADEPENEDNFDVPEGTQYISLQTSKLD